MELIPIVSYGVQRGRCRSCQRPVSWFYPLGELTLGLAFVTVTLFGGLTPATLLWFLIISIGWVLLWIDIFHFLLPDEYLILLALLVLILPFLTSGYTTDLAVAKALGALAVGFFILTLFLVTGGKGMGFGDVKLGFILGWLVGWPAVTISLLAAFVIGALAGLILLASGRRGAKDAVPFGPFLLLGAALAMIWGETAIQWFLIA